MLTGADSSRWLLFAARPAFTVLAVRFSCSQPSFTPFIIPLSVLLTLFTHFYRSPSQNQASPSTPGGLSSRALSCGTTCSPRPQSSLTSPPCLHSHRNRSPQPRLELQKAAQKHLRWINGDGGNLRWDPGLCLAEPSGVAPEAEPVRFGASSRCFGFPVNERLRTRFPAAAFIGLAAMGRLPQRAPPARVPRLQQRAATPGRPPRRTPQNQPSSSVPASAAASRLGRGGGVTPTPFREPRAGPLQSSLKQHRTVAPPEPPRRAWSQKDL